MHCKFCLGIVSAIILELDLIKDLENLICDHPHVPYQLFLPDEQIKNKQKEIRYLKELDYTSFLIRRIAFCSLILYIVCLGVNDISRIRCMRSMINHLA